MHYLARLFFNMIYITVLVLIRALQAIVRQAYSRYVYLQIHCFH